MLCPKCGYYSEGEETTCPECGESMNAEERVRTEGAQAIRQGKRAREAARKKPEPRKETEPNRRRRSGASRTAAADIQPGDRRTEPVPDHPREFGNGEEEVPGGSDDPDDPLPEPSFERRRRPVYSDETSGSREEHSFTPEGGRRRNTDVTHMVNWIKVWIIVSAALILMAAIGWFVIEKTEFGHLMKARFGLKSTSTAYWAVGEERMEKGEVREAIRDFETARDLDAEVGTIDVDGLLMLGNAYEADERIEDAEALYEQIYTETPSRTEAYTHHIRILQARKADGDLRRAGELMRLAYEKTGDSSFQTQRSDLLPAPPEVNLTAGYYETKKRISITSYQGFDVYFTFDENAKLPEDGTLFKTPIPLDEGIHNLRAVATNGELVSDELRGTYKIILPSPQTPRATLAPNTYKTRQRVRLKPGLDNENDDDIVIYYTVDGSIPDRDSPIFTGEPIELPSGWVTLKAVATNRHNKVSNMLEVQYKIEAKPFPKSSFTPDDVPSTMKLNYTTQTDFQNAYGEGTPEGSVKLEGFDTECRKFSYPWGYAVMTLTRKKWILVQVVISGAGNISGPRETHPGDTESYVVGRFCDMMQVESASGNRGLYSNKKGTGKIWKQEDGSRIIRYRYSEGENRWWQLDYNVSQSGTVQSIELTYIP